MSNCAQIAFHSQESLQVVARVSLFRLEYSPCPLHTNTLYNILTLSPLFPPHSHKYAALILHPFALPYKHTHTHCSWIYTPSTLRFISLSPSSPTGLFLLLHSACSHRLFSAVLLSPLPLGPSTRRHTDPSLCWIVEKKTPKFVRNENHSSELYLSEEMTWPAYCAFFFSLRFCWLSPARNSQSEFHTAHSYCTACATFLSIIFVQFIITLVRDESSFIWKVDERRRLQPGELYIKLWCSFISIIIDTKSHWGLCLEF